MILDFVLSHSISVEEMINGILPMLSLKYRVIQHTGADLGQPKKIDLVIAESQKHLDSESVEWFARACIDSNHHRLEPDSSKGIRCLANAADSSSMMMARFCRLDPGWWPGNRPFKDRNSHTS